MPKSLIEVLGDFGIEVKTAGDKQVARCPFHSGDNSPSFTIYPNDTYFCFGCPDSTTWGDALKFLIEYKGWSEKESLEYLGEDYKVGKADKTKVIKVKNTTKTWKFLYDATLQYHKFLLGTPGAINYLHQRGLSDETISNYKIGYTDGSVLNFQFAEEYILGIEIGLITKSGTETLSHRITIPNFLDKGQSDFLVGRSVTNEKPKYLGLRMPKPIIGFYEVRNSPILMIAEGQFDHLILRQWGYPAVVIGGNRISRSNYLLFEGKKLILIPDNDEVGISAAKSIQEKFGESAIILDYSSLGVKDMGEVGTLPNGKERFDSLVKEQLWNIPTWTEALKKSLPHLITTVL